MYKKLPQYRKLLAIILFSIASFATITTKQNTIYWDWKKINPLEVTFSESFLWGTITHAYEVEGNCTNNTWYLWETELKNGTPWAIERSGDACNHWDQYKEDIKEMKELGLKAYCFSLAWEKIEPFEGHFDDNALQHYVDICDEIINHGMQPIVILKDYRDPIWFAYKGGFEREENIAYFIRFCTTVVEKLQNKVGQLITFWNPEIYAINGYLNGNIPPGKKNMKIATTVLKNLAEAHVQTYQAIKEIQETVQIGITKCIYPIEPWNDLNPLDHLACRMTNKLMNETLYNFFKTGTFSVKVVLPPYFTWIKHQNSSASKSLDFIGINYQSHGYMNNFKLTHNPNELATDIQKFSIYPEGLYEAIKQVTENIAKPLNIPIYITQNGIATTDTDTQNIFLKRHLYALSRAINDGYDVRGYFYWTFMDCYTWGGYDAKMGLLTKDREHKEGTQYFIDVINNQYENELT